MQMTSITPRSRPSHHAAEAELFRLLALNVKDYAIFGTDLQGLVTTWNPGAERLLGWREDEIIGRSADVVFTPEDCAAGVPEREMRTALAEGSANDDRWHIRKDGSRFWAGGMMTPLREEDGTVRGFAKIMRDRTDWKLQSEATNSIVQSALDCIISMDARGNVREFNPAAERTFGYRREDVIGRELASLIIPPAMRERHRAGMARYLATGEGPLIGKRIELFAMHADGSEFPVELTITGVAAAGPPLFTAFLRDISDRVRNEQLRGVRFAVTQLLTHAANAEDAATGVLRSVCENLGWDAGLLWQVDEQRDALACSASWYRPELPVAEFTQGSYELSLEREQGTPGRVWASGEPVWVRDVSTEPRFLRAELAARVGLHSAFACAVTVGDRVLGVVEFFSRRIREPDPGLLETMATISGQFGQFLARRSAQDRLMRSERELADFFDNATVGLHWVGPDGTILRANRAEFDLLGYSEQEYVGRNIAEFHADEPVVRDILDRLRAGEPLQDYPARMRCKDGSIRDVLIHSSALFEEGRFVHSRCFTRDITDRKRAEQALRDSEARFRALMEQAPFSVQRFASDGRTIAVNQAWSELWGVTLDQISDYNVLEDQQLEAKGILPILRRAFAGEPVILPAVRYDPNETLPDRSRYADAVRWVSAVAYPLRDSESRIREVVLIHQDRTARDPRRYRDARKRRKTAPARRHHPAAGMDGRCRRAISSGTTGAGTSTPARPLQQMEGWGWQSVHDPEVLPEVLNAGRDPCRDGEAVRHGVSAQRRRRRIPSVPDARQSAARYRRQHHLLVRHQHRHQRHEAHGGSAARCRPAQGRVPGDAGA